MCGAVILSEGKPQTSTALSGIILKEVGNSEGRPAAPIRTTRLPRVHESLGTVGRVQDKPTPSTGLATRTRHASLHFSSLQLRRLRGWPLGSYFQNHEVLSWASEKITELCRRSHITLKDRT